MSIRPEISVLSGECGFNSRIREELNQRLRERLSLGGEPPSIAVDTFHSFGLQQIKRLDKHLRLAPWASDRSAESAHIRALLQSLVRQDDRFALALAQFCAVWLNSDESERSEIRVATGAESFEEAFRLLLGRKAPQGTVPTYVTLNGDTVRSLQAKIALGTSDEAARVRAPFPAAERLPRQVFPIEVPGNR